MAGKGETGDLQRSHGAHPERTGQAQNGRVTSRLPRVGISLCKRGETGNRHRAPLHGDCLYGGFLHLGKHGFIVILFPTINPPFLLKNYFSCDR